MAKTLRPPAVDLLLNWDTLNRGIKNVTEEEAEALLEREKAGQRRLSFLIRIYGKYNTLRTVRERNELASLNG